ncbi:exonuclease tos [Amblyomma americanum]
MGIQGLLPFVQKATRQANIKEFRGKTAAVDTYCWLHKGAFSCAERLVKGEKTDAYVTYCMKMADLLIMSGVRPILVFDGRHLPSKKVTEKKRREQREINRQKAKQFLIEGKIQEARECYQRAVDVTSAMAHEVIKECRKRGIDYIVAPYEADAQLAYLAQCKLADVVITEDSDLILFGCDKVLFKMDRAGFGSLYEKSELSNCFGLLADRFTHDKFRQMCILSGCDYLPSLSGIGLKKANKFFSLITNPDLRATLPKLPSYLKMPTLSVDIQYVEEFLKAENTFRYQLVFCPDRNELVPLNPYDPSIDPTEMTYAGQQLPRELAFDIAVGNIDVNTGQKIDSYVPKDGKVLRARNPLGDAQDQTEKVNVNECMKDSSTPKRLGAFEVAERRPVQTPKTPKTPVRFPQRSQKPLTSLENIDVQYDKQESPLPSFEGSLINNESPADNKMSDSSPKSSGETGNVFKVTPKPRVVRSRFFSTPAAPASPEKKLTDWQIQLSERVCDSGKARQNKMPQSNAALGKFQWSSRFAPQDAPMTPVSKRVSTPFKRLRLSVSALEKEKRNSCVLGNDVEDEEKVVLAEEDGSAASQSNQFSKTQDSGFAEGDLSSLPTQDDSSLLTSTDNLQLTKGTKSLFEVLDEKNSSTPTTVPSVPRVVFKNPFAKVPRSPPAVASDLVIPESDEEDPLPPSFREPLKQSGIELPMKRLQDDPSADDMADVLEEGVESPIPKLKPRCDSFRAIKNHSEDLDYPNYLDESPWPVTEKTEQCPSVTGVVEESDDDELTITRGFIVKRPIETPKYTIVKPRIPPKPIKRVPPKQRRLGLPKSATKRDAKQQSLLESFAKFQFKK